MLGRHKGIDLVDTPEMDKLFTRLERLNEAQLMAMAAFWKSVSHKEHEDAWAAVRVVGMGQGLAEEIDRVRDRAVTWASRGSNLPPAYSPAVSANVFGSGLSGDPVVWQQLKLDASEAIVDAALATALGDRLDAESREALIGPWLRATEAPE